MFWACILAGRCRGSLLAFVGVFEVGTEGFDVGSWELSTEEIDGYETNGEDDGQEAFADVLYRTLLP